MLGTLEEFSLCTSHPPPSSMGTCLKEKQSGVEYFIKDLLLSE